ncbi:allantoin racemase [Cohaesibacter sp. ES.047]|uniref:aspartate/glutamate racemase family protein n=1 Tax=Cohaesibacter sp. ES.047 TaxID=1798205 RepID=UPI000BB9961B|nr:aspartate/glutamate racemase family protein [Cohaesibacter sp. ES.047]SNY91345.1 allantoin racemase [Cohaesibacter sp. ES.047]
MHILVINPNSTAAMTKTIGEAAQSIVRTGTRITAVNPTDTPPAIQGPEDGAATLPGLFRLFDRLVLEEGGFDACVIACFDDTGLAELRLRSPIPVIGVGEAAFHAAMLIGGQFSVVTTLSVSIPVIEANLDAYGFSSRCHKVRASEVPVLELETNPQSACERIAAEIERSIANEDPGAIVLGCAGMVDLAHSLSVRFGRPVLDGVSTAVALCEALFAARNDRDAA